MFEGFPNGPWIEEGEDILPPDPPKWWEIIIVVLVLSLIGYSITMFFAHGF